MRSEKEMTGLILDTALKDERIRAVVMNGSRVNPNAKKDIFQDYDIVYFVQDVKPFRNHGYIEKFGELLILQVPEDMRYPDNDGHYTYLMQFKDGNRIDLSFYTLDMADKILSDSLSVILIDKDGVLGKIDPPGESSYYPKKPDAKFFKDCCNNFWWVYPYAAKALWRKETLHARHILENYLREELMNVMVWYFGIKTDFKKSPGKACKDIGNFIEPELYALLKKTFPGIDTPEIWDALYAMENLFRKSALYISRHFGFEYNRQDDENVSEFIKHIQALPDNAEEIY